MEPITLIGGGILASSLVGIPVMAVKNRHLRGEKTSDAVLSARRALDPAKYGLVPAGELDARYAGPDPEADAVREAALAGDWRTAAEWFAATGRDEWDLRWYRLGVLAYAAAEDDRWLRAWHAECPGDPAAALVYADMLVVLAGEARGAARARHTSAQQFEGFHRLLAEALPACREAARLAPDDPSPWVVQITIAMGLNASHQDFHALWAQITARDPHHFGAHMSALQYWCAKWQGSEEAMFGFVDQAAASAPRGSLLPALRLYAVIEQELADNTLRIYREPYTTAAVDATLRALAQAPPGHHRIPMVRHLLAQCLFMTRRYAEAVEQFYAIGRYIGGVPWTYSADPVKAFVHARTHSFLRWDKAGRPPAPRL
ncbi:hypothetical protein ABZ442_21395 [Streptomyces triculaminicus]|uniref:hypothetical protein n=1 Tax=Streptomyces triculaminicus TaxID=2816232 RepID=UPI0033C66222